MPIRDWQRFGKLREYIEGVRHAPSLEEAAAYSGYSRAVARRYFKKYYPEKFRQFVASHPGSGSPIEKRRLLEEFLERGSYRGTPFTREEAAKATGYNPWALLKTLKKYFPSEVYRLKGRIGEYSPKRRRLDAYVKEHQDEGVVASAAARAAGYSRDVAMRILKSEYPNVKRIDGRRVRHDPRLDRLDNYVRNHRNLTIPEAAYACGYSTDNARRLIKKRNPKAYFRRRAARGRESERYRKLAEYVAKNPNAVDVHEVATFSGYSTHRVEAYLKTDFPEVWAKRKRAGEPFPGLRAEIDAYEERGEPPHVLALIQKIAGDDLKKSRACRNACRRRPYFHGERTQFLARYMRIRSSRADWDGSNVYEELARAERTLDGLTRIANENNGAITVEGAATIVHAKDASLIARAGRILDLFASPLEDDDEAYDRRLEAACVEPPQEYLDDVYARDCLGVRLPPEAWARYYDLYCKRKAGKLPHANVGQRYERTIGIG